MNEVYHKALYVTSVVVCDEGKILIRDLMRHEALILLYLSSYVP